MQSTKTLLGLLVVYLHCSILFVPGILLNCSNFECNVLHLVIGLFSSSHFAICYDLIRLTHDTLVLLPSMIDC